MRKHQILALALTTILILASASTLLPAARTSTQKAEYAPGEIIIKLRDGASDLKRPDYHDQMMVAARSITERSARFSTDSIESIAPPVSNHTISEIAQKRGLDRTFVLRFDHRSDIDSIIKRLKDDPAIEYAEPNYLVEAGAIIPNDPEFRRQWGLRNLGIGVEGQPSYLDCDIKATMAWTMTTGSPDVVVAVTDSGVDITHPDLESNIYINSNEIPGNGIDDDRNGYIDDVHGFDVAITSSDVSDILGHGTQMSGIIAASLNNQIGISGVSQSKILPVKFFRRTGPGPFDISATVADAARALLYSVAAGAKIINASWRTLLTRGEVSKAESNALRDAVLATQDAGALLVSIAGNEGYNNDLTKVYPSAYRLPNQIVVAASDYSDQMWHPIGNPFFINSGYGPTTVDLTAPGVSIRTTTARGDCFSCSTSDDPEDWYVIIDGTSASAAFVSGVAALIKSFYPDAHASVIRRRILESVEHRDALAQWVRTGGRLNAQGALAIELEITPPVLTKVKYKKQNSKLIIDGQNIQYGVQISVGGVLYAAKPVTSNFSRLEAIVPKTALPARTPVEIFIRNADGGESQRTTMTR